MRNTAQGHAAPESLTAVRIIPQSARLATMLLAATLALPACTLLQVVETPRTQRGNRVDPDQLKELVIGTATKADVSSLLGSPTAKAAFNDNRWLYISELTKVRIGRTPGVLEQNVVALTFDEGGVLRNVNKFDQEDSRDVAMVSRSTPSPGSEASFLQQLLGNIGKFSTGGASGSTGSGGSSGPGASNQGL